MGVETILNLHCLYIMTQMISYMLSVCAAWYILDEDGL
jgi:hypothetical protein